MKANETTVRQVLQGETQYVVPLYQRRYSWEHDRDKDPLGQLWNDLMLLVNENGVGTHFLGSIVLAPSPANTAGGITRWIVVDGQQRLTTLSVLLCAIRDHVMDDDPQLGEKIHELHLVNKYARGLERYRLLPTQEDRASWMALVDRSPEAGGEDRIGTAYRYFRAKLVEFDDPEDDADVRVLEQTVTARLALVSISAHPEDNVHRIFESLNHKGQPLTQADLLRNYLFMRLPTRGDDVYTTHWLPLQQLLSDSALDELIWLDLVLQGDEKATQAAIYRAQQVRLDTFGGEDAISDWVRQLHHRARLFRRILSPQEEPVSVIRTALQRLDRWGSTVVHPITLHVLEAHERGVISGGEVARALRVVESFQVRRTLVGIPTNNLNRILMSLVKDLGDRTPTAEAITEVLSAPRKRFPTNRLVREAVLVDPFYLRGRGHQQRHVLRSLEEDHRHGEQVDFDASDLSIEHVLPQSPSPAWLKLLEEQADPEETSEEVHASVVTPNAHRVLKRNGHISPDFRWPDPNRTEDPREVLVAEGVRFDEWSRADQEQRMTADELNLMIAEDLPLDSR